MKKEKTTKSRRFLPFKRNKATEAVESQSVLKKYSTIIISVALFLIVDISILGVNYYAANSVERSAREISIASRQSGFLEDIAKNLTDINLIASTDYDVGGYVNVAELKNDVYRQYNALKESETIFNMSLNAFIKGGQTVDAQGHPIKLDAMKVEGSQETLAIIQRIWLPYKGLIDSFITAYDKEYLRMNNIAFAADYARIYTTRLLAESNNIAKSLETQAQQQADRLRLIQIVGIILAISIFLFIVFRALGALLRSDAALARSRRETTEIMDTIQEGLFLIDSQYEIGEQQSKKLGSIFPVKDIAGKRFDEILEGVVAEKDIVNTRRFINQLFNRKTRENLIDDLNPLRRVLVTHKRDNGSERESYLQFNFARSYSGKNIQHVLVSITDITESVELENRLLKEKENNELQLNMLIKLLRIEPDILNSFMRNTSETMGRINEILRRGGRTQAELRANANEIFREVHSFKGEASALELDSFVNIAEEMENTLHALRKKTEITGNDFLSTTIVLEQFFTLNKDIQEMHQRLLGFDIRPKAMSGSDAKHSMQEYFEHFAQSLADRNQKKVTVEVRGFDEANLSEHLMDKIKEITVQLLRNAIVHGIETPDERRAAGKPEVGKVSLMLRENNGQVEVLISDDGQGINLEAIRTKLVSLGKVRLEDAAKLTEAELHRALFLSGLSTADKESGDAGRGVGMDIVKDRIAQLKGKIQIRSEEGKFSRFLLRIPH